MGGTVRVGVEMANLGRDLERRVFCGEVLLAFGAGAEGGKGIDGENLLREDVAELAGGLMGEVLKRGKGDTFRDLKIEAGDWLVGDATRVDELEVAQVGGDVEGESVGGDPAGDVDADGADFSLATGSWLGVMEAAPDARKPGDASGANAIDTAEADQGFFHHADKVHGTEAAAFGILKAAQVEDGVADELAGTVIGNVAAAVDFVKSDAAAGEEFIGREDVGAAGVATECQNGRMFEQEKSVVDVACEAHGRDFRLNAESFVVGYAAEVEVLDHGTFIVWMRAESVLGCGFKDTGKVRSHTKEDKQPEQADDEGHGKTGGSHGDVGEVDIDDDARQDGQSQGDVAIDEQQETSSDLEEADGQIVVGDRESSIEIRQRSWRNGWGGKEVKQHVRSKEGEDDSEQVTGNCCCDFHGTSWPGWEAD